MTDSSPKEGHGRNMMGNTESGRMDGWKNKRTQEETEELTQSQRRSLSRPDRRPRWKGRRKGGLNINEGCWKRV